MSVARASGVGAGPHLRVPLVFCVHDDPIEGERLLELAELPRHVRMFPLGPQRPARAAASLVEHEHEGLGVPLHLHGLHLVDPRHPREFRVALRAEPVGGGYLLLLLRISNNMP